MNKYKRIFLIVMDSLGIGNAKDAKDFHQNHEINDEGSNTWLHISQKYHLTVPNLEKLGLKDLVDIDYIDSFSHPNCFTLKLNEESNGKDTMTGHWEMMGIKTTKPFQTFTDTGFPQDLINELEKETGYQFLGNKAASGTAILDELGEQSIKEHKLILYTSSDSVLQIAGSEEYVGLNELYRVCEIARKLCMKPEWFVGRVIARPFVGNKKGEFHRTSNRHDYTVSPTGITAMNILKENGFAVSCVGKINDIFNGVGVTETVHSVSNIDGMNLTMKIETGNTFKKGLCFVNLVEFDSEYGHRRNPVGYGKAIEDFDKQIGEFIDLMKDDDLLMITADHGNDPTWGGTDHTREQVPLFVYSKSIKNGRYLGERDTYADIGDTILTNFGLKKDSTMIGSTIEEVLKD